MDNNKSLLFSAAPSETRHSQPLTASPSPASPRLVPPSTRASGNLPYPPSAPDASFRRRMPATGNAISGDGTFVGTSKTEVDSPSVSYNSHSPPPPLGVQGDRSYNWHTGCGTPRQQLSLAAKKPFASLSDAPALSPCQPSASSTDSDIDDDDDDDISLQSDLSELPLELEGTAPAVVLFTHQPHLRIHHAGTDNDAIGNQTSKTRITKDSRPNLGSKRAAPDSDTDVQSDGESGEDQGDGSGTGHNLSNQEALQATGGPLSCPYRKRNKKRFNYRTHRGCTAPFKTISLVKTHIKKHHKRLEGHERRRATEEPQRKDVEDGITPQVENILIERQGASKVCTWESLWKALFPNDTEIPSQEHEQCLLAETHEFVEVAENVRTHSIKQMPSLFAEILRNGNRTDPDALASELVILADNTLRGGNADYLRELERRVLQESSTTARSKRGRSAKASEHQGQNQASRSQSQRPPFSSRAPIAPESSVAAQLSPPVSLSPYAVPPAQLHSRHVGQEAQTSSSVFQPQIWSAHTPKTTDSVMNATPFQNSVLPGRMDQILPSTQWAGSESTRQDFQIGMQQDHPIQQSAFPVAQPSSGDIYPSHQGPVFYTDPRQPSTPQAQGHDTFTYGTQADGYYQNTQGAFGGWQHMPGSDGGRREG